MADEHRRMRVPVAAVVGMSDGAELEYEQAPELTVGTIAAASAQRATYVVGKLTATKTAGEWQLQPLRAGSPFPTLPADVHKKFKINDIVLARVFWNAQPSLDLLSSFAPAPLDPIDPISFPLPQLTPSVAFAPTRERRPAPDSPSPVAHRANTAAPHYCAIAADCGARFGFSPRVSAQAQALAAAYRGLRDDLRHLPFITIDPPAAQVLDQAIHIERDGSGLRLRYAIVDIDALLPHNSAVDVEAQRRGASFYMGCALPETLPRDTLAMLPAALSSGAGSLLPQQDRAVVVADVHLSEGGEILETRFRRAMMRSRARLTTGSVQWFYDHHKSGHHIKEDYGPSLALLQQVGELLMARAARRGALMMPFEEPHRPWPPCATDGAPRWSAEAPVSRWSDHISMTVNEVVAGKLAAAQLRAPYLVQPDLTDSAKHTLRQRLHALGVPWLPHETLAAFVQRLDAADPRTTAIRHFVRALSSPTRLQPSAAPHVGRGADQYVHFTAPLRRYEDVVTHRIFIDLLENRWPRYQSPQGSADLERAICDASTAKRRQSTIDRRRADLQAAQGLAGCVGQRLAAVVLQKLPDHTLLVLLRDPGLKVRLQGDLPPGQETSVLVERANYHTGELQLSVDGVVQQAA